MSSEYQMWLTHNGESEKIRFPVLPEVIHIKKGISTKSVPIQGLGEVVIKQDPTAIIISFSSFFPSAYFPGIQVDRVTPPSDLKDKITIWQKSDKPVRFFVVGTTINLYFVIEEFSYYEQGGDVGSLYYTLSLKEYRKVSVRQITVDSLTQTASLPAEVEARIDNREQPQTYTVVSGDCLWTIAQRHLGDGSRYTEIYELNKDMIKNPSLISVGQVLKLPA